jgi:hypothetical protein
MTKDVARGFVQALALGTFSKKQSRSLFSVLFLSY